MKIRPFFQEEKVRQIRIRKDRPCAICGGTPTRYIMERIPGSKGRMSQSFAGDYRLCDPCFALADRNGAIESVREPRSTQEECTTVYAKTYMWLKQIRGQK